MKKQFLIFVLVGILFFSNIGLAASNIEKPSFQVSQMKSDPYPVEPGEYATLWIQVYNTGTETAENVTFELDPEYPFSLDPNEKAKRSFSSIPGLFDVVLKYKIRVDSDAVDGDNELNLKYKIGEGGWVTKEMELYVNEAGNKADLEPLFVSTEPKPYPGGETTLKIDLANVAPGTAYYTVVGVESPIADIPVNKIFIGTLDADDFDTLEFDLEIKENITPGTYPVKITSQYKNEEYEEVTNNGTVDLRIYTEEEAKKDLVERTPWYMYVVYLIVALVVIKYLIVPWGKKAVSYFKK